MRRSARRRPLRRGIRWGRLRRARRCRYEDKCQQQADDDRFADPHELRDGRRIALPRTEASVPP
jgi:hypothetical protein